MKISRQFKKEIEATLKVTYAPVGIDCRGALKFYRAYYNISECSLFRDFDHAQRMKLVVITLLMSGFEKKLLQLVGQRGEAKISSDAYEQKRQRILSNVAKNYERYKLTH